MDSTVTASPSLTAITDSPPEEDVLCWLNMGTGIPVYIGGGGAVKDNKKSALPSLCGEDPGPLDIFQAQTRGNQTPQNWVKTYPTYHESFKGW